MYIKVVVTPGAKKETVTETGAGCYEMTVREPAAQNRANIRIRELVASVYTVPVKAVKIISGHRSRTKVISLQN